MNYEDEEIARERARKVADAAPPVPAWGTDARAEKESHASFCSPASSSSPHVILHGRIGWPLRNHYLLLLIFIYSLSSYFLLPTSHVHHGGHAHW